MRLTRHSPSVLLHCTATGGAAPVILNFCSVVRRVVARQFSSQSCTMAAPCRRSIAATCCLFSLLSLCNAQSKQDVSVEGIYDNVTAIAGLAASLKDCSANDTLCQAVKELFTPPTIPPGAAPVPAQNCRKLYPRAALGPMYRPLPAGNQVSIAIQPRIVCQRCHACACDVSGCFKGPKGPNCLTLEQIWLHPLSYNHDVMRPTQRIANVM